MPKMSASTAHDWSELVARASEATGIDFVKTNGRTRAMVPSENAAKTTSKRTVPGCLAEAPRVAVTIAKNPGESGAPAATANANINAARPFTSTFARPPFFGPGLCLERHTENGQARGEERREQNGKGDERDRNEPLRCDGGKPQERDARLRREQVSNASPRAALRECARSGIAGSGNRPQRDATTCPAA